MCCSRSARMDWGFSRILCTTENGRTTFCTVYVKIEDCAMYGHSFSIYDIILAHCRHVYHLWCLLSYFRVLNCCVDPNCSLMMPPLWLKSFGITELAMHMFVKDVMEVDENTRMDIIARWELIARSL